MAASALSFSAGSARAARLQGIGLQMFTVREPFQADPAGTLEKVAKIGYREVEFGGGGYDRMDPEMLRRAIDHAGLTAPALHASYDSLVNSFDASLTMARALGAETVVLSHMTPEYRNPAAWTPAVAEFNRIAGKLKKAGLGFAYHNHAFEFDAQPGGLPLYEILLRDRDPALIGFELDLYWLAKAGQDSKALIRRLAGQIYSYHVKDMAPDGAMAAVGTGTIDFAGIFALNHIAGVKRFFVENDRAPAPYFPDIETSFNALNALHFQPAR